FVTRLVLLLHVVEKAAALAHHLQQAATRMVVLRVALEVFGKIDDTLGKNRDLHFRRTGVAVLAGKFLDQLSFALRRNRHRASPQFARLKTRTGRSSPCRYSVRATGSPRWVARTDPERMGASRPRNKTP